MGGAESPPGWSAHGFRDMGNEAASAFLVGRAAEWMQIVACGQRLALFASPGTQQDRILRLRPSLLGHRGEAEGGGEALELSAVTLPPVESDSAIPIGVTVCALTYEVPQLLTYYVRPAP